MSVERVTCPGCDTRVQVVTGPRLRKHTRYVGAWPWRSETCPGSGRDVTDLVAAEVERERRDAVRRAAASAEHRLTTALRDRESAVSAADQRVAKARADLDAARAAVAALPPEPQPAAPAPKRDPVAPVVLRERPPGCDCDYSTREAAQHRFGCSSRGRLVVTVDRD